MEGVKLAHNRGHQNALLCGLMSAMPRCDAAISMDADLQDDIDALDQFVQKFREGCDVVYGVRNKRDTDTWFKRTTAEGFYKVMKLLGVDVVFNHADYRLMSKRALEGLSEYREVNLFLRGIVPLIGYRSDYVYYDRHERFAGESKYPLKKMISFALDGITSFSVKPLKLISNLGILISILSVFGLLYALISYFFGVTVSGWTAIVCSIWLLGGLQMLCLGVVGGYIGKIYSEVKARPRFRVEEYLENGEKPKECPAGPQRPLAGARIREEKVLCLLSFKSDPRSLTCNPVAGPQWSLNGTSIREEKVLCLLSFKKVRERPSPQ